MGFLNRLMFFIALIIVFFSLILTVNAVSLPDEKPGIVSATAQKDKAAIVLITTIISGEAKLPSFELQFAGGTEGLVGTWIHPQESFTFNAGGTFRNWSATQGYDLQGTYATNGNQLSLTYQGQTPVTGTYSIVNDTLTLSFPSLGITASYTREGSSQETDMVANAEAIEFVPVQGETAKVETYEVKNGGSGTGFIVSSDGYIVTNAHVVFTGVNSEQKLMEALFGEFRAGLIEEISKYYNVSGEDKERVVEILSQKFIQYFLQHGSFSNVTKNSYVVSGKAKAGENLKEKGWQAIVKKEGSIMDKVGDEWTWGRDVAVIKVNQSNLPSVRLGDSDKVEPGNKVFVIGYPDTGLDEFFKPTALMEPTVS